MASKGFLKMKTQEQLYYDSFNRSAQLNHAFLDAVKNGLTKKELQTLIQKRPNTYKRFENWIAKLKE
jgi:hypothetical protein